MNDIVIILLASTMIPIFIMMMFMPYWTRKTESFGVSIPESVYTDQKLKTMRKQYASIIGVVSILLSLLFALTTLTLSNEEEIITIIFSSVIVIFIICSFFIYLYFHRKMKDLKQVEQWTQKMTQHVVIDTSFRNQRLVYSNRWFIIPFAISFITIILTLQFYHLFPEIIPMQYNFSGDVTNFANKSYRTVLIMPIMQVYMTSLFLFINIIIARAKQQTNAETPEESIKRNIIFRKRWSLFIIISGTALVIMFSFIHFSLLYPMNQTILFTIPLVITFGTVIGAVILSFTTGQGGSRLGKVKIKSGEIIDRDDDQYWKLGQFYFNKDDPSLFLEKRFGIGWTNNWARPLSWILLLIVILLAVGIPILLMM